MKTFIRKIVIWACVSICGIFGMLLAGIVILYIAGGTELIKDVIHHREGSGKEWVPILSVILGGSLGAGVGGILAESIIQKFKLNP